MHHKQVVNGFIEHILISRVQSHVAYLVIGCFLVKTKRISILLSILVVLTVLGSTFAFSPVFANPVCGATITANTTLTANIGPCSGTGLTIGKSGITLNCAGHTISGSGDFGILLFGVSKVTVENCKVTGFLTGIAVEDGSSNTLTKNTANNNKEVSGSGGDGFFLYDASSTTLSGNTANSNTVFGFELYDSSGNTLSGNTANSNGVDGFSLLRSSKSNTLTGNTANNNKQYGYLDTSTSSSPGIPHWDTANSYMSDKATGNVSGLAAGNPNIATATSPF
jgi:parallel beta-helix repeat protein